MVRLGRLLLAALLAMLGAAPALAEAGHPVDWQLGMQDAVTPIAEQIHGFHAFILVIIVAITLFVLALLLICVFRFNEKRNPVPSKTSHNTLIEVVWTVVPVIILVVIAVPSFRLLFAQYTPPAADLTLKVIGNAWYWDFEYPDAEVSFSANVLEDNELTAGKPRLLAVNNETVVPVGKVVRVQVTSNDVIHSFAVPSFGVKVDALPGRLNETWFRADKEGVYYGQCSELCGARHAYMPLAIRVVTQDVYDRWLAAAKTDIGEANKIIAAYADGRPAAVSVASR